LTVPLRVGTRGSALALAQSKQAVALLEAAGTEVELIVIRTSGDKMKDVPLAKVGGKGLFIKELEEALQSGSIDFAIHSMKDVPAQLPEGFSLGAISTRADERDVLVRALAHRGLPPGLDGMPVGARIGTGSLRRRSQLLSLRPDLEIVPIRGNVDTRIGKAESGELDAVVLAAAGIARLGLDVPVDPLPADIFLPSAGQGFLAIEIRTGDTKTERRLEPLHDPLAAQAATAERAFVGALDASCTAPVAAWCRERDGVLVFDGLVASLDGQELLRSSLRGEAAEAAELGRRAAGELQARGAARILADVERQMAQD
jgi:hydroxymethylbilane synthase